MRQQNHRQISIRGFIYPALLFLGAGAVAVHFAEGKQIWPLLRHSDRGWLALARRAGFFQWQKKYRERLLDPPPAE